MKQLTKKEEEVMRHFWQKGAMFVRELVELYPNPKPHFNTLSTVVRSLEAKGCIAHESYGNTYRYYPTITEEEYGRSTIKGVVSRYFENSYLTAVSALVEEEKISLDELRELIARIEKSR
ncbi:MAG: BlaI/MecI/CopY family transcriptional regulator [Tidjanibacter sp.]|nr:BlaI/MecI/CopY family transcriptional regulator [Tidjanibacter sp.]